MNLEELKKIATKYEEIQYTNQRGKQFQCVVVMAPEMKLKVLKNLSLKKTSVIESQAHGELDLNFLDYDNVTRVSLTRKKSYKSMRRKLSDPHPEQVGRIKAQIKKSKEGKLPGVPVELLEHRLKESLKDTLFRRAELSAKNLPAETKQKFLSKLQNSDECLVTNFHEAHENLWMTIQSNGKSIRQRARIGVNLVFSAENHIRADGLVGTVVEAAQKNGWIAGDIVLI
jgi:hypothetical protein